MSEDIEDSSENGYLELEVDLSDAVDINRYLIAGPAEVAIVDNGTDMAHETMGSENAANYIHRALTPRNGASNPNNEVESFGNLPDPDELSWSLEENSENSKVSLWVDIDESAENPYTAGYSMMTPVEFEGDRYDLEIATSVMMDAPRTLQDIERMTEVQNSDVAEAYQTILEGIKRN